MKNILYISKVALKDSKSGTPLRILNLSRQIRKEHNLTLSALSVDSDLEDIFVKYLETSFISKIIFFKKLIKEKKIDVIFVSTDMEIVLPIFLKILTGVKIVIDIHGLYAEEMYFYGLMSKTKRYFVDKAVKFLISFYNLVIVAADNLKTYYAKCNKNIEVIYNGVNAKDFISKKRDKTEDFVIGYAGNMKEYQGFNFLLEACRSIKKKNKFDFKLNLILSSGTLEIEDELKKYGLLENSELHFKVSHNKVSELLANCSALIVPRINVKMTEYAYPSKLPEYLMTGIPVITTNVGPVKTLFSECSGCIIIDSQDIAKNLEEAICSLHDKSFEEQEIMGKEAIQFVEERLEWSVLGNKINKYLNQL